MKIRKNTILNKLNESALKKIIPFHMPGHKRNIQCSMFLRKLGAKYDITEIPGYDNMHNPDGIILNVMQKAEKLWNSKRSFLLINGSTCGIQAAINTLADPKDKIIVARNCHKSVYNMIELQDLKPVFINPVINNELGIYGSIEPETLDKVLTNNPDAKLVIVTSPTYEGVISDIKSLCQVSHNHNVPIVVDEAHGAHLKLNRYFDNSAITAKADIVIQSLHKTLPSLTQTAIAHVCSNNINCENFQRNLSVFQTSSPSYILLSSIEGCIDLLLEKKDIIYTKWIKILDYLDSRLARLKNVKTFYHGLSKNIVYNGVFAYDRAKLVINTDGLNINGKKLFETLAKDYGIICEMYSGNYVLAMLSMCDKKSSVRKLCNALEQIDMIFEGADTNGNKVNSLLYFDIPKQCLDIRTARKKEHICIPLNESVSRICAEYIWAYPPGIPLLIPGEQITSDIINMLLKMMSCGIELKSDYNNEGYISVLRDCC